MLFVRGIVFLGNIVFQEYSKIRQCLQKEKNINLNSVVSMAFN